MKGFLMFTTFVVLKMYVLLMALIVLLGISQRSSAGRQALVQQQKANSYAHANGNE